MPITDVSDEYKTMERIGRSRTDPEISEALEEVAKGRKEFYVPPDGESLKTAKGKIKRAATLRKLDVILELMRRATGEEGLVIRQRTKTDPPKREMPKAALEAAQAKRGKGKGKK